MWQLYVLGALLASATENVIDKAAIVQNVTVDFLVASFWRPLMFFIAIAGIGLLGFLGPLHFFFHWSILLIAPFGIFTSLFYTYLLKNVELTSINAAAYLVPLIFLFIDSNIAHVGLHVVQVAGIFFLVLGGVGFALDGQTLRIKKELNWRIWCMFIFNIAWGGTEAYLFKYLNVEYGMNGVSFFATLWLICSVLLLIPIIFSGKIKLLFARSSRIYIAQSVFSKGSDALSSALWTQALVFAAVSQVSAFEAVYPLVLFLLVLIAQGVFRIPLKERFGRMRLGWKAVATLFLVVGGVLVT